VNTGCASIVTVQIVFCMIHLEGVETTERDPEQPITYDSGAKTEYCGQACLAFACVAHAYGYNVARLV
jgi:hypothetical protein